MDKDKDYCPILVQFENGRLKGDADVEFQCCQSKANKQILYAKTATHTYSGTRQKTQQLLNYYVAVIDKETGTISKVSPVNIFNLSVQSTDAEELVKQEDLKPGSGNFIQKNDSLIEAFGSSKQKRQVSSRKKNENVRHTITQKVADIAQNVNVFPTKAAEESVDDISIIPPMNVEATSPADIFNITDIIPKEVMNFLRSDCEQITDSDKKTREDWSTEKRYPQFVLYLIGRLPTNQLERTDYACYISYLNYMMMLYRITFQQLHKLDCNKKTDDDPCPDMPNFVKRIILRDFTMSDDAEDKQRNRRSIPKKSRDKLLCHMIIISLMLEEFEVDISLFLQDLKLSVSSVSKVVRAIGGITKTSSLKRKATAESAQTSVPVVIVLKAPNVFDDGEIRMTDENNTQIKQENNAQIKQDPDGAECDVLAKKLKYEE